MPLVRAVANRFIAALLVVVSLGCLVTGLNQLHQQRESAAFTHCTAEWQADFLRAYEARAMASVDVSDAMDGLVRAVAAQDRVAFQKALRHYLAVRDRQNEERVKHPLPPLPAVRCGS